MPRVLLYATVLTIFFAYSTAHAANTINWTFYGPGASGRMQGSMKAATKNLEGDTTIRTLDDVRTGKSKYVTLASASSMRGRFFCIGTVTYTSPPGNGGDGKTHTLSNVVGYVHDTGCAFNGTCSCAFLAQFCNGQSRPDKMDIAVGNFSGYDGSFAMNYITKNPNRAPAQWTQIAGLPQPGAQQNPAAPQACGSAPKEEGIPTPAKTIPPLVTTPQNPLQTQIPPAQQPASAPRAAPTGGTAAGQPTIVGQTGASPAYYGAPSVQTGSPQPNSGGQILPTLFQQSSATSGIRVVQNMAQQFVDLFTVPTSATKLAARPTSTAFVTETIVDESQGNVSLMVVSQYDEPTNDQPIESTSVLQESSQQTSQQVSTFGTNVQTVQSATYTVQTTNTILSILASFRSLLESIMQRFTGR